MSERRSRQVFVIMLCGAGDRPTAALGERTPLEFAHTPNLDDLARAGALGHLTVIDDMIAPESDSGAMALLGFDPLVHYTGRGPLEALGIGFWPSSGPAVGFRINFASRDHVSGQLDRRTARDLSEEELQTLASEIRQNVGLKRCPGVAYELTAFGRHRGILCFTSASTPLSGEVSNTDPGFRRAGPFGVPVEGHACRAPACVPLDDSPGAVATASAVNEFVRESAEVLAASEVNRRRRETGRLAANVVLFRDAGDALPELPQFVERTGATLALYGQIPAERGLCTLLGARFVNSRPTPEQREDDYYENLARALAEDPADVVLVHLKGADEPGHDGDALGKAAALADIDRCFIGPLCAALGPDDVLLVTGDHATPCELGIHSADPVPTLAYGAGIAADDTRRFGEREAAAGGLPITHASQLLSYAMTGTVVA